jgi:GT2 family glycosyltransferase
LASSLDAAPSTAAGLLELAKDWPRLKLLGEWDSVPYSHAVNLSLRAAQGEHLVVLSDEVRASPGWLSRLIAAAEARRNAGVVAARCPGTNLYWQRASGGGQVPFVREGCLLIPRAAFAAIGEFDDRFLKGIGAEDYCLRAQQRGYHVFMAEGARVRREPAAKAAAAGNPGPDHGILFEKWYGHPLFPL